VEFGFNWWCTGSPVSSSSCIAQRGACDVEQVVSATYHMEVLVTLLLNQRCRAIEALEARRAPPLPQTVLRLLLIVYRTELTVSLCAQLNVQQHGIYKITTVNIYTSKFLFPTGIRIPDLRQSGVKVKYIRYHLAT